MATTILLLFCLVLQKGGRGKTSKFGIFLKKKSDWSLLSLKTLSSFWVEEDSRHCTLRFSVMIESGAKMARLEWAENAGSQMAGNVRALNLIPRQFLVRLPKTGKLALKVFLLSSQL